jgi:hypothetical protein
MTSAAMLPLDLSAILSSAISRSTSGDRCIEEDDEDEL